MTYVYRAIVLFLLILVVSCQFKEKDFWKQATAALVGIPLVIRMLLVI